MEQTPAEPLKIRTKHRPQLQPLLREAPQVHGDDRQTQESGLLAQSRKNRTIEESQGGEDSRESEG